MIVCDNAVAPARERGTIDRAWIALRLRGLRAVKRDESLPLIRRVRAGLAARQLARDGRRRDAQVIRATSVA
ncbi:MAG: hypothetical protein QOF78_973 [Phycisphaerales bacterium]|nr:hypothetical protein [Phycisphaerales bacterium]